MHDGHDEPVVNGNGDSTPVERDEIAGVLRQEQQERQEVADALKERDDKIDELTSLLARARDDIEARQQAVDNAWIELTSLREAKDEAVSACRDALRMAHPELPADLIRGETVEELTASVQSAATLVEKVRAALQAEKNAARVPAGAPVSAGPDLEGLSPRDKIAAGVTRTK